MLGAHVFLPKALPLLMVSYHPSSVFRKQSTLECASMARRSDADEGFVQALVQVRSVVLGVALHRRIDCQVHRRGGASILMAIGNAAG